MQEFREQFLQRPSLWRTTPVGEGLFNVKEAGSAEEPVGLEPVRADAASVSLFSQRCEADSGIARHLMALGAVPQRKCGPRTEGLGRQLFPSHAARSTCSRLMFHAIVTSDHSPRALSRPRMLIWRQPITASDRMILREFVG